MQSVIKRAIGALGLVAVAATTTAEAQPMGGEAHLSIESTTDFSSMHAGEVGLLAIDIIVEEGWHTYWPGISDTGYGISFDIDTPDSVELKDPIWPSPERYLQRGGILDHTYEGTQTVLVPFAIRENTPDSVVVFTIKANYLVCDQVCLPGKGSTSTSLHVVDDASEQVQTSRYDELRAQLEQRPQLFNAKDAAVRLQWISKAAAIMFRDATRIEFYPDNECSELESVIEDGQAEGNRLEVRFTESENKVLSGRLRVTTPEGVVHYDINEHAP
ncbi:MAG: protein-disulfide reductase DsbD domain-containing protein [Phycisphaerales bacterium JB052]